MSPDQWLLTSILLVTIGLFIWGGWRHDFVALTALLLCVVFGLVPESSAFTGFAHPAVITVAFVLILSGVLQQTGAADRLLQSVMPKQAGRFISLAVLVVLAAILSGFMNNVGALAILMPVALQVSRRLEVPPGQLLMPLAFGSILGGMTTMIGTPPNLIVSGFRQEALGSSFSMFDFTPVGLTVMLAGVVFILLLGWRLVPVREKSGADSFDTGAYLSEVEVSETSQSVGLTLAEVEDALDDAVVVALIRGDQRYPAPHRRRKLRGGDVLVIEAEPEALLGLLGQLDLALVGAHEDAEEVPADEHSEAESTQDEASESLSKASSAQVRLMEVTLMPQSRLNGRSVTEIDLRDRYQINLLAVSRQGRKTHSRMSQMALKSGDLLLLQGRHRDLMDFSQQFDVLPLADRDLNLPDRRQAWTAGGLMLGAVAAASFGLLPAALAFVMAAMLAVFFGLIAPRRFYDAIDWPVIVLLGALIPVAQAVGDSGLAQVVAQGLVEQVAQGQAVIALALVLIVTMTLSDFMNNAATAAVMCPIAISTANALGVSPDPLLMAVAIGASCAFLTPIGHQNNTLILGPGGFRFADYWRLGLPMEVLVVAVSLPMLLWVWPL